MTEDNRTENNIELPLYLFHQGTNFNAYDFLGCHFYCDNGTYIYTFRTWAPNAKNISVIGDISNWNEGIPMVRISHGIWECNIETKKSYEGTFYKYRVEGKNGTKLKSDPYGLCKKSVLSLHGIPHRSFA